ncbi:glycosyltransferase family protein [uncultured Aliiroseovarius sp.]|uniref:glycosyltransferase family protein n=1 Tax=uncultured Aliiroseovarius sp. TaxID=1658783 RepID=UPI0025938973|nr:glycosyltransferase family protein [uncultured Aliiroseovarius sp.]
MPTIPVIVQARMSSTRLPGKVMKPFSGKTFLEHNLDRCAQITGASEVIVATTDRPDCNDLAEMAKQRGYRVHRGSQEDVLGRYLGAAREVGADAVMRITSDCPLIDPRVGAEVLTRFLEGQHDLVATNIPPSWPNGMDVEVISMKALEEAGAQSVLSTEREHVSTYIRRRPMRYRLGNMACPMEGVVHWRLTLDTQADHDFFQALASRYSGNIEEAGWNELFAFLTAHPDLLNINSEETIHLSNPHA